MNPIVIPIATNDSDRDNYWFPAPANGSACTRTDSGRIQIFSDAVSVNGQWNDFGFLFEVIAAQNTADLAVARAATAQARADLGVANAKAAFDHATDGIKRANAAQSSANHADKDANDAYDHADDAYHRAINAQNSANSAQGSANSANTNLGNYEGSNNSALSALTTRVANLEAHNPH